MQVPGPWLALSLALAALAPSSARAQEARAQEARVPSPTASVLRTAAGGGAPEELAATLDRALRTRLDALGQVEVRGSVALDLGDLRIALGCEGESAACLGAIADEVDTRYLLIPNLDQAGAQLVFTLGLFDSEGGDAVTRATREAPLADPAPLMESLDAMLIELLGAPRPPQQATPTTPPPSTGVDVDVIGGAVLAALGAAALGIGIGLGASSLAESDAYAEQATPTEAEARLALGHYRTATDLALGANIAMALGGGLAAAGLVWLIAGLVTGDEASDVQAAAYVSPTGFALALSGTLPEVRR